MGYSHESKGYRLLNDKKNKVVVKRDDTFNEIDFGPDAGEIIDAFEIIEANPTSACQDGESEKEKGSNLDNQYQGSDSLRRST